MRIIMSFCAVLVGLLTAGASAQQSANEALEVQHAWARASAGKTAAAYFSVTNKGAAPDRLMAIKTPVAQKAELHEDKMENGIMRMRSLGPLAIEPGQSLTLKPGADHVMLINLAHPLKEGESFPLTLSFEKAGDVRVMVQVEHAGAMGDAMPHMPGGMGHSGMQ